MVHIALNDPTITVDWRIAGWAENVLVVMLGIAMAGLAAWLVLNALKDVLERAAKVEALKAKRNSKVADEWMAAYRDEHARRIAAEQKAEQEKQLRKQIAKGADHAK